MASEVVPSQENWRIAEIEIMKRSKGDRVEFVELEEWFGSDITAGDFSFQLMRLRASLREEHGRCLSRIRGETAFTVSTDEQIVGEHIPRARKGVFSSARRMGVLISSVDASALNDDSRRKLEFQKQQAGFINSMLGRMNRKLAEKESMRLEPGTDEGQG